MKAETAPLKSRPVRSRIARLRQGAAFTVFAALAAVCGAVPEGSPPVATLTTSMVELLDADDAAAPMSLGEVRKFARSIVKGVTGRGIDVALIDTGVAPVEGLIGPDKVLHGPDLSFEATSREAAFIDTYGHGTHMAGIIAGNRVGQDGVAPNARIVSVKVAGHDGLTTVPQVVAAIDWVVEHRNRDGLNIRVLNLSLGQAGVPTHIGDHLSAAVERAWDAGIFVVVAAGNRGESQKHLDSPAVDPYVMAAGAWDAWKASVPAWSAHGSGLRDPETIAPGRSVASYRVPGSTIDRAAPHARHGDGLFLGSGTSQAAAVISGAAALVLETHPTLRPDQLKAAFTTTSLDLKTLPATRDGHGSVNAIKAHEVTAILTRDTLVVQRHPRAAGAGTGIVAPTGATWSGGTWSGATWSGATWSGATWSGGTWSGATWSGATWSGATWSGATWSGATWSGATWSGATWSGATWNGATWSAGGWR